MKIVENLDLDRAKNSRKIVRLCLHHKYFLTENVKKSLLNYCIDCPSFMYR